MAEEKVDVLICGSGSAGLCAAVWLAIYKIPNVKIIESRDGPMTRGQADGVQCRTVEIFESLGISEELLRESYHVLEVTFWSRDANGEIQRTKRIPDVAEGLSHLPHVILNQARINGLFIQHMQRSNNQQIDYSVQVKTVTVDSELAKDPDSYAVTVEAEKMGQPITYRAKYVLGCDGAHSSVRRSLGFKMVGDSRDSIWGVMDVYPITDFPDYRKKATFHTDSGSVLIIPREGDSLTRFYIELPHGTNVKEVHQQDLIKAAQKVFHPYKLEIADTFWWSCYAIGQRLADNFHKDNRVFLTGDSCHTHSPKAGQGMNCSLQDGWNMGWKLAAVLQKKAPVHVLETYTLERAKTAKALIDFDRDFAKLFSSRGEGAAAQFRDGFIKAGRYTAGLTATYDDSVYTNATSSKQDLAKNITVGMRFPTAQVVRNSDVRAIQLMKALKADGRWRIVIFGGDLTNPHNAERVNALASFLDSANGPIRRVTPTRADPDSVIEALLVLHGDRDANEKVKLSDFYRPVNGPWRMKDVHKIFVDDKSYNWTEVHGQAYAKYGVDPREGCLVVVRPDQYVSLVVGLEDYTIVSKLFESCLNAAA